MYRIVFTSRASRNFTREEIKELCEAAAVRNRINGITGLFMFDGSRFLQALEGDEASVVALMKRIATNPKHFDLIIVSSAKIDQREFSTWSMSQPLYGIGDDAVDYVARIKNDLRGVSDDKVKALFIGFAYLAKNARFRFE